MSESTRDGECSHGPLEVVRGVEVGMNSRGLSLSGATAQHQRARRGAGSARALRRGKAEGVQQTAVSPPASGAKVHWADFLSFLPFAREESQ